MKTGLFDRGVIGANKGTNNFQGMVTPDVVAAKALRDAPKADDENPDESAGDKTIKNNIK